MRSEEEIEAALSDIENRVWLDRHVVKLEKHESGEQPLSPEELAEATALAREMQALIGEEQLGPYDDTDWGILLGKLSALRWVTGSDWDEFWS